MQVGGCRVFAFSMTCQSDLFHILLPGKVERFLVQNAKNQKLIVVEVVQHYLNSLERSDLSYVLLNGYFGSPGSIRGDKVRPQECCTAI